MFWSKRLILKHEQYRLMTSVEDARKDWNEVKQWRLLQKDELHADIPVLLAEVRYRYLLEHARKRNWVNKWYMDF